MGLRKDIWRPAIVGAPIATIAARGSLAGLPLTWLPERGHFRFLADPFGRWHGDHLHIFTEAFDYRDRHGVIELLIYDRALQPVARRRILAEPWHLSYPFVFEGEGEIWLLPEAFRSGRLTLYRAVDYPWQWEAATTIKLPEVPVDATLFRHEGRWWLCYAPAAPKGARTGRLHVAYADRLAGPWTPHPGNPLLQDVRWSRPGGTPFVADGAVMLPVQDCSRTYGGAIRLLRITTLTPDRFIAEAGPPLLPPADAGRYCDGLHTLAAAGDVTLVDMKRSVLSLHGAAIGVRRRLRQLTSRAAGPGSPARSP